MTEDDLVGHLVRHRIAGSVGTDRSNSLRNYRSASERDEHYMFGLNYRDRTPAEVLATMVELVGVSPDPAYTVGPDRIDPDRTVQALRGMRERLAAAADARAPVLLATGHPGGLLPLYLAVAAALAAVGCELLTPANGASVVGPAARRREIRYVHGVGAVSGGGGLDHTHSPEPMRAMLADLPVRPALVVADHGYAGAAGEAGLPVVGFGDCNDPAIFLGAADGKIEVAVPLDDNLRPDLYRPLWGFLLASDPFRLNSYPDELPPQPLR